VSGHDIQSRRKFLRSAIESAARNGFDIVSPRWRDGALLVTQCGGDKAISGPETDRARAGECATSGDLLAALNDLSGIYEP